MRCSASPKVRCVLGAIIALVASIAAAPIASAACPSGETCDTLSEVLDSVTTVTAGTSVQTGSRDGGLLYVVAGTTDAGDEFALIVRFDERTKPVANRCMSFARKVQNSNRFQLELQCFDAILDTDADPKPPSCLLRKDIDNPLDGSELLCSLIKR